MLSKQQISYLRSLHQKKFRQMYGKFLVEGDKLVQELLESNFKVDAIYKVQSSKYKVQSENTEITDVTEAELQKISTHENPNQVVAVAEIPKQSADNGQQTTDKDIVVLCDNISDPGNAGTIIRTAEWFGAKSVVFSENSVDIYNPKVVSAAKGSLFRMPCFYADLRYLLSASKDKKVYGTFMRGENIYKVDLAPNAFVIIGNEANGISEELESLIDTKVSIPSFGKAESLNAGVATAVVLSEFARRKGF